MQAPRPGRGTFQALALGAEELGKERSPSTGPAYPRRRPRGLIGPFAPHLQVPEADSAPRKGVKERTQPTPGLVLPLGGLTA